MNGARTPEQNSRLLLTLGAANCSRVLNTPLTLNVSVLNKTNHMCVLPAKVEQSVVAYV